jgi:parallel beta-helix repeat protein
MNGWNIAGIIIVNNTTGAVTITNLQVDGRNVVVPDAAPDPCYPAGIVYVDSPGTIQNVNVVNMNTTTPAVRSYGIWLEAFSKTSNNTIKSCSITGYYKHGIVTTGDKLTFQICNNYVTGPGLIGPDQVPNGIAVEDNSTGSITYNIVTKNRYNNLNDTETYPWLSIGIFGLGERSGTVIRNNIVYDNDIGVAPTSGVNICNNKIYKNFIGVHLENGASNNTITDNTIINNHYGIHLLGPESPYYTGNGIEAGTGNNATRNNIYKNAVGIQNWETTQTFSAQNNWWGTLSGPYNPSANPLGKGNSVSDYVNFTPWAKMPGM